MNTSTVRMTQVAGVRNENLLDTLNRWIHTAGTLKKKTIKHTKKIYRKSFVQAFQTVLTAPVE